jgi:parvulin-like peptidyl-prolyl isomerase
MSNVQQSREAATCNSLGREPNGTSSHHIGERWASAHRPFMTHADTGGLTSAARLSKPRILGLAPQAIACHRFAVVLVLVCMITTTVNAQPGDLATTLVTVNGTAITSGDLEFLYLARGVKPDLRDSVRDRFVEQLIDRQLLKVFLASRKIVPAKSVLDDRVQRIEKLITREGLEFDDVLKSLGYTRKSFRDEVALPLTWRTHARLVITDAAIERYWNDHRAEFDGTEVRAAHIVKRIPKDENADVIKVLQAALVEIRKHIESGTFSFAQGAKDHSDSPSGKDGGDLGEFSYRGRMPVEFSRVAFALKTGEVSEPFQTRFGLHLLTVTEIIPGDLSLEDARPEIFQHLSSELQKGLLTQLREKAEIVRHE